MLEINDQVRIPLEEFQFSYSRSAGPGGQNVNKVNSKAILHWNVAQTAHLPDEVRLRFLSRYRHKITTLGDVVISGQRFRDQPKNAEDCLERLKEMIQAVWLAPVKRKKTKPSRGVKERRLQSKREQSERKEGRRRPGASDHD
jgi:ribosome-associated protein